MIPIVLHHGFGAVALKVGPVRIHYFRGIGQALERRGHPVIETSVHPTAGIATRAAQLKTQILAGLERLELEDEPVLLIGHSMGGLDARYMISKLDMQDRVAALLTVTSPHRGSPVADWCIKNLGERFGALRLLKRLGLDVQGGRDLTTESCRRFNDEVPDAPQVKYFSTGAARPWHRVPAFAIPAHKIVTGAEGANDALVSTKSSIWGTPLGIWPADHWHTINNRLVLELKDPTGDITPYYEKAVERVVAGL